MEVNSKKYQHRTIPPAFIAVMITAVILVTTQIPCHAYFLVNNPAFDDANTTSAGQFIGVCRQLGLDQIEIENHIEDTHGGDASLFIASSMSTNLSDYTQIIGSEPSNLYYTDGCPSISLQLPNSVTTTTGRVLWPLENIKIKKTATCSTVTGRILKWTGYTDMDKDILKTLKHKRWCEDVLYDKDTALSQ